MRRRKTEVVVQLFITSIKDAPTKITELLEIKPTETWLRGTPISQTSGVLRRTSGWKILSPLAGKKGPEEQVDALIKVVKTRISRFRKLPHSTRIDLSCAIYAEDDSQRVFSFSKQAIRVLAEIGASINVAYYCPAVSSS